MVQAVPGLPGGVEHLGHAGQRRAELRHRRHVRRIPDVDVRHLVVGHRERP